MGEPEEKLQASVTAAQQEIAGQLVAASLWETRLMGFLGFLAVTEGALLTVAGGLADSRWMLLVGATGGIAIVLGGLMQVGELTSGPNAINFYVAYQEASVADFRVQMLADLGKTILINGRSLERRNAVFVSAVAWAAVFSIWFGLVRVLR
jgi:hypothetical protein